MQYTKLEGLLSMEMGGDSVGGTFCLHFEIKML